MNSNTRESVSRLRERLDQYPTFDPHDPRSQSMSSEMATSKALLVLLTDVILEQDERIHELRNEIDWIRGGDS